MLDKLMCISRQSALWHLEARPPCGFQGRKWRVMLALTVDSLRRLEKLHWHASPGEGASVCRRGGWLCALMVSTVLSCAVIALTMS